LKHHGSAIRMDQLAAMRHELTNGKAHANGFAIARSIANGISKAARIPKANGLAKTPRISKLNGAPKNGANGRNGNGHIKTPYPPLSNL
jgi:hypothetical protein